MDSIEELLNSVVLRQSGTFGRHKCELGWVWDTTLRDYDFWFVIAGQGNISLNGARSIPLKAGSLALLRPDDVVHATQNTDDQLTVLFCHFEFVDRVTGSSVTLPHKQLPGPVLTVAQVGPIADVLYRAVRRLRDRSTLGRYAASGMLMDLLSQVYVQQSAVYGLTRELDSRLQDAIEQILEHPARRWLLEEVARSVGLSARELSRLFVDQLGTTFRRYTVDIRLDRARDLLEHTVMDMNQIANLLGYSDQFLFSRQFRAKYGEPPSSYRSSVHNRGSS